MPHGGRRPGAGRPKGKQNAGTLEKARVRAEFDRRVMQQADQLFNAHSQ